MSWIKRTALALAAGAVLSLSAVTPGSAAAVGQSAAIATADAAAQSDGSVVDIRRGRHYGGGGRHGYRRYGNRHGGFRGWWVPFVAAPLLYGGYSYGRGYGNSCYSECRSFHGPNYCRYNWRRYC
jgi:hypothetical protein